MLEKDIKYNFFDSHAHYYDDRFYGEENTEGAEALLSSLFAEGLLGVINIGTSRITNAKAIEQAAHFEKMYAAVGLHPTDFAAVNMPIDEQIAEVRALIENEDARREAKIVAIGEIGLDYYWEPYDRVAQKYCFEEQLKLAEEFSLPVIIHDREAHGDSFETVLKHPKVKGVFHSYSGSAEMAYELARRGWYISFSGVVSFKNAHKVKEAARAVPLDRLLIETDAPYLAPHPYRGKINHSGRLFYTATALAEEKGIGVEDIAKITYENAKTLFKF